mmetsp:Transcript_11794/g.28255  ORF Transcript_11794/g.28255 Transcript_11794/m.28255 type:complete len:451 (-) Transcript_11794:1590-2942(-)
MKVTLSALVAVAATATSGVVVDAFTPSSSSSSTAGFGPARSFVGGKSSRSTTTTARALAPIDPSHLHDLPQQLQSLQDVFASASSSSLSIADAVDAAASVAADAAGDAVETAASKAGPFGFLTAPTMAFLQLLHSGLAAAGLGENAWGVSIIVLTLLIKLLTYPLTKSQLESTNKMQALQPTMKEIQTKYQSNPEVMNQKIAELYQTNQVNPLAGCIPSLVQIPVFIGLYRAVLDLAQRNQLDESFLWLPSLEGPVYGADPTKGSAWLFDGWVNGAPSLGWHDTISFLILPVFLVISQYASMELMAPKDQAQEQPFVLKLLPLMIGWFSLNVPSALCVYWVTNNIVTTATSIIIRNSLKMEPAMVTGPATTDAAPTTNAFTPPPMREKPAGFGDSVASSSEGVTPITSSSSSSTVDAEIVDAEIQESSGMSDASAAQPKKRGKKKKKRRS